MKQQDKLAVEAQMQNPTGPRCGAQPPQRFRRRTLCWMAVLLALVGFVFLWCLATSHRRIPQIMISDIQPVMKLALVRVVGKTIGEAHVVHAAGKISSLHFVLADGTGELTVVAEAEQAQQMALWDRVPRVGDAVEVIGRLRPGADASVFLQIQPGATLKLQRMERVMTSATEIHDGLEEGAHVMLTGVVTRVTVPRVGSRAQYLVTLRAGGEEQQFVSFSGVMDQLLSKKRLVPGVAVQVQVTVVRYAGKLRLTLGRPQDIVFPAMPTPSVATNVMSTVR